MQEASTAAPSPALSAISHNPRASILDSGFRRYPQTATGIASRPEEPYRRPANGVENPSYFYKSKGASSVYSEGGVEIQDDHINYSRATSRRSSRNSLRNELDMKYDEAPRSQTVSIREPAAKHAPHSQGHGGLVRPSPALFASEYSRTGPRSETSDLQDVFGQELDVLSSTTRRILMDA
jgi:hypothetical protein